MLVGVRGTQTLVRTHKDYLRFIWVKKQSRLIQKWWKRLPFRRFFRKMKACFTAVQSQWRMKHCKAIYTNTMNAVKLINRVMKGGLARKRVRGIQVCKYMVNAIIQRGIYEVIEKPRTDSASLVQKNIRGYLCRKTHCEEVKQIKLASNIILTNKSVRIIQRNAKGFIARSVYNRLKRATAFIQGHIKMIKLHTEFRTNRLASIKAQRAIRKWLIRKRIIIERMVDFLNNEGKEYQKNRIIEQAYFFNVKDIDKPQRDYNYYTMFDQSISLCYSY